MRNLNKSVAALLLVSLGMTACDASTPEEKAAQYTKHGKELFAEGKLEKARIQFKNAARLKPTDADVFYQLGLIEDEKGNFPEAFSNFIKAEQQDNKFIPTKLKLAEYFISSGQYEDANSRLDAILAQTPDDAQAHALIAARNLKQKLYNETAAAAQKSLQHDQNNYLAFAILASLYKEQNNLPKAIATIEDGVNRNPKNVNLLSLQASLYEEKNDLESAAKIYHILLKLDPAEKKYRVKLASNYIKSDQLDLADEVLKSGVSLHPDDWEMKRQYVIFLNQQRGIEFAEKEVRNYLLASPDHAEPLEWLVDLYISRNLIDQAASYLQGIIAPTDGAPRPSNTPLWLEATGSMARINYLQGNKDQAAAQVASVLEKSPNNLNARFLKSRIDFDRGEFNQAAIDLRGIIRDNPRATEAYSLLSDILLQQGHINLAIETLNQLLDIDPRNVEKRVKLAYLYTLNGDTRHAMDILFIATKTNPDYAPAWDKTARIAIDKKDWQTADAAIDKLTHLPGQETTALLLQGAKQILNNQLPEAIATFSGIIRRDPTTTQAEQALNALVQAYKAQGKLLEATAYLETIQPSTARIDALLGQSYLTLNKNDQAAEALERAIAKRPQQQDPYLDRAKLHLLKNEGDLAINVLEQATKANPADYRAQLAKGQLSEQLGRNKEALQIYSDLNVKFPENDLVSNNLSQLIADHFYTDVAQLDHALRIAERFSNSNNPLFLDTLGWVYYRQGRMQEALAVIERAKSLSPNAPAQIHYHHGAVLKSLGQDDKAEAELRQATASEVSNYPGIDDARSLLKSLTKTP